MDFLSAFETMDQQRPFLPGDYDPNTHEPVYHDTKQMEEQHTLYKLQQPSYNIQGYISPYPTNNWDTNAGILSFIEDSSRFPAIENPKLDPNKIFSSDIAALRALAADQSKATKLFEKRLIESLSDRGKFGLTEEDIMAMQALTSARQAITAINKEQIAIKGKIADLKIKQQERGAMGSRDSEGSASTGVSSFDQGRSLMDRIFDVQSISTASTPAAAGYTPTEAGGLDRAEALLDSMVPGVSSATQYESSNPKTYVLVGETDDDVEYATYTADGDLIPDYPNPDARIESIDRDNGRATNELLESYPIKFK